MRRGALPFLLTLLSFNAACGGTRPTTLGVHAGALGRCPPSPNCVSSIARDEEHGIAPLDFGERPPDEVQNILQAIITATAGAAIIEVKADYLYAEYTSSIWGFVDDVELYFPAGESFVHVRSASRIGHSDLGANRDRIEALRDALNARLNAATR